MPMLTNIFWAGVLAALMMALWDCQQWPRQTEAAWRRFRWVALAVVAVAAGFFLINLLRYGSGETQQLITGALRLTSVAVASSVFFCGGWVWVSRAGHVGLFERVRRRVGGLRTPSPWLAVLETLAIAAGIIFVSYALFQITHAEPSAAFQKWRTSRREFDIQSGYAVLMVLLAPFWEESAFRWYLLNRLEERLAGRSWARLAAIVMTSAFWACGHAELTNPVWIKLVQIFVVGCVLAWRFRTIGLSGCVLAHLAMNLTPAFSLTWAWRM